MSNATLTQKDNQMTSNDNKLVTTHLWQEQGLGVAPFSLRALIEMPSKGLCEANPSAYNNAVAEASRQAAAFGVHLCSCYSCGQSLMNNVVVRDAKGDHFVVGIDCALKCGDTETMTKAEKMRRDHERKLRNERKRQRDEERRQKLEVELQAQRDRNGGLTNYELQQKQAEDRRRAEEKARFEKYSTENAWLIDVLKTQSGDFCADMANSLKYKSLESFSDRQFEIMRDIFAKNYDGRTRRNSKKYDAGCDLFDEKSGVFEDVEKSERQEIADAAAERDTRRTKQAITAADIIDIMEDENVTITEAIKIFRDSCNQS